MSQYKTDLLPASVFFRRLGNGGPYEIGGEYEYSKNLRKLGDVDGWNKGFANETDEGFSLHRLTTAKKIADAKTKKPYKQEQFIKIIDKAKYKFYSGPFAETIFKIIGLQKNKINILLGNVKTTIKKNDLLYNPL